MAILDDSDFVVIESGPLKGVTPSITYYQNKNSALVYIATRRTFFATIDLCKVQTRITTVEVPTEIIEGDPLV